MGAHGLESSRARCSRCYPTTSASLIRAAASFLPARSAATLRGSRVRDPPGKLGAAHEKSDTAGRGELLVAASTTHGRPHRNAANHRPAAPAGAHIQALIDSSLLLPRGARC